MFKPAEMLGNGVGQPDSYSVKAEYRALTKTITCELKMIELSVCLALAAVVFFVGICLKCFVQMIKGQL